MFCEPNFNLPQKIDINSMRKSDRPYFAAQDVELKTVAEKEKYTEAPKEYNVLPSSTNKNDYLKSVLSLRDNDYLLCRWHQFLDNIPDSYVRIKLYMDYNTKKEAIRKLILNGNVYGIDNKLAPIPQLPDPRKLDKSHQCGQKKTKRK